MLKKKLIEYLLTHSGILNTISNLNQKFTSFEYLSKNFSVVMSRNLQFMNWIRPALINDEKITRLGSKFDGGYVIPDDYNICPLLISIGLGKNIDFERDFLSVPEAKVIGVDASIEKYELDRFTHIQSFVRGRYEINPKSNEKSFESLFPLKNLPANSILKIDCEGDELKILDDMGKNVLKKFRILIVEIHNIPKILSSDFQLLKRVMNKITAHFQSIHIHANNGTPIFRFSQGVMLHTVEITFVSRYGYSTIKTNNFRAPKDLDSPTIRYLRDYDYSF